MKKMKEKRGREMPVLFTYFLANNASFLVEQMPRATKGMILQLKQNFISL